MKLKNTLWRFAIVFIFTLFLHQNATAQCFEIESILVDACDGNTNTEGLNEMVRFKVGTTAINTSNLTVTWPNNTWGGLIQNALTATKVANLNADILDAGGCGQLIQPVGGVLPANATVILVTSYNFDITSNSFGALTDNVYILFQNSNTTSGHFANYGTSATRTLTIAFGSCSDTVSYNRSLLITETGQNAAGDGATVIYTPSGTPTYINNGCIAPVPPFTVDAGNSTLSVCVGNTVSLNGTAQGQQTVLWSAPSGTFSAPTNLATTYTPSASSAGTVVVLTLTVTNSCGTQITDTINLTVTNGVVPNFNTAPVQLCSGSTAPVLSTTSPNGIVGTWSPAIVSNTTPGTYIFTPNNGQCASSVNLVVSITPRVVPNFSTQITLCSGNTAPILNTTSPNGIVGTWSPATVSNTTPGTYTFTPNAGQCATSVVLQVIVTTSTIVPNFNVTPIALCSGSTAPILNTISPNGIVGTWSPATVSNTTPGTYVFTPTAGQCATSVNLAVTITPRVVPNFNPLVTLCSGSTAPILSTTSPNGIVGTWSPAVINNTTPATYTFTPNAGQCASSVNLAVVITPQIIPNFNTQISVCSGSTAPILSTTSPNGIIGTWSPATISNTIPATYTFTPIAGQCASSVNLAVTITSQVVPNFSTQLSLCSGSMAPILNTTSPNGIVGTWSPAIINNTTPGTYTFTPNAGQCATVAILQVNVTTTTIVPNFDLTPVQLCSGSVAPILNNISPNGIAGTWSPATISNTTPGTYTFTPNAGQCATPVVLNVAVTTSITPNFATSLTICKGNTAPVLSTTSPNGISGTWSPATINTASNGSYIFTPNAGQCAGNLTLNVTIESIQAKITESCIDSHFVLQAVPVSNSYDANTATYTWKNEAGQTVGNNDELFDVYTYVSGLSNATYPMNFTVTVNNNGCDVTEPFSVPNIACNIPKGISPNGDGDNDEFDLTGFNVRRLEIFNRYGKKVNSFTNYRKEWRGQSDNGNDLPDGTYYYVIEREGVKTVSGWVQINRQRN